MPVLLLLGCWAASLRLATLGKLKAYGEHDIDVLSEGRIQGGWACGKSQGSGMAASG